MNINYLLERRLSTALRRIKCLSFVILLLVSFESGIVSGIAGSGIVSGIAGSGIVSGIAGSGIHISESGIVSGIAGSGYGIFKSGAAF